MTERDFVFLGPSLPQQAAAAILPDAVMLPPVQMGDLYTHDIRSGDRVLIIDGLFLHSPAVRHREILGLLERGVIVAGSSSMGALRAAELAPFGMRGYGRVFALYADGTVTGDDEVAIVHGPAEDGYRAQSVPLVNVRIALADAVTDGELTEPESTGLRNLLAPLPFRERSFRGMDRLAARRDDLADAGQRFANWRATHPHDGKRQDALTLLEAAARNDAGLRPHGDGDRRIFGVHTRYVAGWRAEFAGAAEYDLWITGGQVAVAIMLLHQDFPRLHRETTTADIMGSLRVGRPGAIVSVARERGLIPAADLATAWSWLTPAERATDEDAAAMTLLLRMFGTRGVETIDIPTLPVELRTPPVLAAARRFVAAATQLGRSAAAAAGREWPAAAPAGKLRSVRSPLRFRTDIVQKLLARLWSCREDELVARARDRGFLDLADAVAAVQPFVPSLKAFGAPRWAAVTASDQRAAG